MITARGLKALRDKREQDLENLSKLVNIQTASNSDGTVSVQIQGQANPSQVGLLQLANFINPAGVSVPVIRLK